MADTLPMWRVQTRGDIDDLGLADRIFGLVSRPQGFEDSPDAEIISAGVNTKSVDGVALARHGSYFHWGFSASPTHMTPEAQLVFLNAIHYISRFDGAPILARKQDGVTQRASLANELAALAEDISARRRAGEQGVLEPTERFKLLKRYLPVDHWASIAADAEAVLAELNSVSPYLYPSGYREMGVDRTLQELGLPSSSVGFLRKMESWLAGGEKAAAATELLQRYSTQSYKHPERWLSWLERNRGQFFFSESAGYVWLSAAGDSENRRAFSRPTDRDPVVWESYLEFDAAGELLVTLELAIQEGWHIHVDVPDSLPYQGLEVDLELPDGLVQVGDWHRPLAKDDPNHPGHRTLEGDHRLVARLKGVDIGDSPPEAACTVSFQACNVDSCLPPAREQLNLRLKADPRSQ